MAQCWAQHRLLSLLCSQSYIFLGLRGQLSACCYQISYRKYMVRLGTAKGDKFTPGASRAHTSLPTTAQTLSHTLLCLSTHFLCPVSLPQFGFVSFLSTHCDTQAVSEGSGGFGGCHMPCAMDLVVICETWARKLLLAHWIEKCSLKLGVIHHFCVFFMIPIDFVVVQPLPLLSQLQCDLINAC